MNTFTEKVTKFSPVLDKIFETESLTAFLEKEPLEWVGARKIKRPTLDLDGAGDYDRDSGYVQGGVTTDHEEYELEQDRGRKFYLDVLDNDEVGFALFEKLSVEFVRTKIVPEVDAYRFTRMIAEAGHVETNDTPDILDEWDNALEHLGDNHVPTEQLVAFVSFEALKEIKQEMGGSTGTLGSGRWDYTETGPTGVNIDRRVNSLDGIPLIPVPRDRFEDSITLQDGTTGGQTAGGYTPDGKDIHFIICDVRYVEPYYKRQDLKIIDPGLNQDADAWIIAYRMFHDLIVSENKEDSIYALTDET